MSSDLTIKNELIFFSSLYIIFTIKSYKREEIEIIKNKLKTNTIISATNAIIPIIKPATVNFSFAQFFLCANPIELTIIEAKGIIQYKLIKNETIPPKKPIIPRIFAFFHQHNYFQYYRFDLYYLNLDI